MKEIRELSFSAGPIEYGSGRGSSESSLPHDIETLRNLNLRDGKVPTEK